MISPGQKYQHYKRGHIYEIIALAKHSATLEDLVVYRGLYIDEEFGENPVWVRPLSMFIEKVEIDGNLVDRFKLIK